MFGAIENCDANVLPCIGKLLHVLCTMQVTTLCAEHSFFCLRALKTWLRARMGEERVETVRLGSDVDVSRRIASADLDNVINELALKKSRRLNVIM